MTRVLTWIAAALLVALLAAAFVLYTPDRPRAALEARYAAPPSRFVEVEGTRLHIRDTGPRDEQAVLLLHGFGSSLHTWDEWARILEARFRVIRLDLPGFGLTGADPRADYSDTRAVAILAGLLDTLSVPRADVIGSSMGGRLAWRFAAEKPDRVRRLVLMAPDGFASAGFDYDRPAGVPLMMRALPWTLPMPLLRGGVAPAYADQAALTDAVLERYRDMMLAPGVRQAILDRMATHALARPEPFLRRIQAPVLLLWGQQDRMVPAAHAADYERELRDRRTVILPGLGHVPMEEDPARSAAVVTDFLSAR
ncbi:alpha/beta fold hydrolase [Falsiroseomonas sp. HW251]|uniref:alpha/beta fold hydrolase n=1 Tax=Falsiroseomonas sp. HW251 TaxID=3390998 RepID=UPI003D31C55A